MKKSLISTSIQNIDFNPSETESEWTNEVSVMKVKLWIKLRTIKSTPRAGDRDEISVLTKGKRWKWIRRCVENGRAKR